MVVTTRTGTLTHSYALRSKGHIAKTLVKKKVQPRQNKKKHNTAVVEEEKKSRFEQFLKAETETTNFQTAQCDETVSNVSSELPDNIDEYLYELHLKKLANTNL